MTLHAADLVLYAALLMPTDDVSPVGGAINPQVRLAFNDLSFTDSDAIEAVSTLAIDTQPQITVTAVGVNGLSVVQTLPLNGLTPVSFTQLGAIDHVEACLLSHSAQGAIQVRRQSDKAPIATIPVGELGCRRMFQASAAAAVAKTYWMKAFWKNTNAASAVTAAFVTLTPDPEALVSHCIASGINDSGVMSNRITAPSTSLLAAPYTFNSATQNVPGNGTLNPGDAIGVWYQMVLPANNEPIHPQWSASLGGFL